MSETIGIARLSPTLHYSVEKLTDRVATKFPTYQVRSLGTMILSDMAFDSSRNQYHSTRILADLEANPEVNAAKYVLGIIDRDLYVPGMNFVFGEARCPGRVAVISTYRLQPDDSNDLELFESRIVKEAVHEIGHTLGLRHCSKPSCVMYFSESITDTDRKKDVFCSECGPKLKLLEIE